jgi:hypothetical protein
MRSRNLKPGFFKNEELGELDHSERLLFAGLWCLSDREGFFENRPKRISAEIFPFDEKITGLVISKMLCNLMSRHVITLNDTHGYIPSFLKHNNPHPHEAKSDVPEEIKKTLINQCNDISRQSNDISRQSRADIMNHESLLMTHDSKKYTRRQKSPTVPIPESISIYRDVFHYSLNPAQKTMVTEGVNGGDLTLWRKILTEWAGHGWNPKNVTDMLKCFKAGKITEKNSFNSKEKSEPETTEKPKCDEFVFINGDGKQECEKYWKCQGRYENYCKIGVKP